MTDLVVLVLVVVWVAFLAPRVVRHFREGQKSSIEDFHEQLHLLERAGPKFVEPAYRLGSAAMEEASRLGPVGPHLVAEGTPSPRLHRPVRRTPDPKVVAMRRRRRDVLLALIGLVVVTGALGALHALHLLWAVTGVSALAIAGYVALVAYAQLLHAERDATRPIVSRPPASMPPWAEARPRHAAGPALPGVEILTSGSASAARAGYPGAWDDDELVATPRHAANG